MAVKMLKAIKHGLLRLISKNGKNEQFLQKIKKKEGKEHGKEKDHRAHRSNA